MPARVATDDEQVRHQAVTARQQFIASGTNVSHWARDRGFSLKLVHAILRGDRSCRRGESHRIAVALGIKIETPAPGHARVVVGPASNGMDGQR
jgi:gp16 family phage-associated protein